MRYIGITGVARSGKDTLCGLFSEWFKEIGLEANRFALADELKEDIEHFIFEKFHVNIFTAEGKDKELIRPIMVSYGGARRKQSNGVYWTSLLEEKFRHSTCDIGIITDMRYAEYEKDEDYWVKDRLDGELIHITRFDKNGLALLPPNSDEAKNDPIMKERATFQLAWSDFSQNSSESIAAARELFDAIVLKWGI